MTADGMRGLTSPDARRVLSEAAVSWKKVSALSTGFAARAQSLQLLVKGLGGVPVLPAFKSATILPEFTKALTLPAWKLILKSFEGFAEAWRRSLPTNWRDLPPGALGDVIDIMGRTGIALVWLPRREVVEKVVSAVDDAERLSVLLDNQTQVLEDVRRCLGETQDADLAEVRLAAERAVAALEDGHPEAAQALAAAALTACIEGVIGWKLARMRREYLGEDPMNASIQHFRLVATCVPLARATLSQFDLEQGDPVPGHYNRHATLHTVSPVQFTAGNALTSVMLVASVLRELQSRA